MEPCLTQAFFIRHPYKLKTRSCYWYHHASLKPTGPGHIRCRYCGTDQRQLWVSPIFCNLKLTSQPYVKSFGFISACRRLAGRYLCKAKPKMVFIHRRVCRAALWQRTFPKGWSNRHLRAWSSCLDWLVWLEKDRLSSILKHLANCSLFK